MEWFERGLIVKQMQKATSVSKCKWKLGYGTFFYITIDEINFQYSLITAVLWLVSLIQQLNLSCW